MPRAKRRCAKVGCRRYHPCTVHPWGWENNTSKPLPNDWKSRCKAVRDRDRVCVLCGSPWNTEVDHILPRSAGGSDALTNLQLLCHTCHTLKTAQDKKRYR